MHMSILFIFFFFNSAFATELFLNSTHDPSLKSWVESANDPCNDFPIQNLPFCIFKRLNVKESPRIGVAIGQYVLDIKKCIEEDLFTSLAPESANALSSDSLNNFMGLTRNHWRDTRYMISNLLQENVALLKDNEALKILLLVPMAQIELLIPVKIENYTDFYASIHHATNIGSLLRPDQPLLPNYKYMPIGYHGRASSIVMSDTPITWPSGQIKKDNEVYFGPSEKLDFELELGALIGPGNNLGSPISISEANDHIFGFVLVNDWSARDIQAWEYQPLGPFNSKNFATTISPWIVTLDALIPFLSSNNSRDKQDPLLLNYLRPLHQMALNIDFEIYLSSKKMRLEKIPETLISKVNAHDLYWSFDQIITHHTCSGCNLKTGDLLASGTVSGPTKNSLGCLFERVALKMELLELPDGTHRQFLQDGDEVIFSAYAKNKDSYRIGFGACKGVVSK